MQEYVTDAKYVCCDSKQHHGRGQQTIISLGL